MKIFIQLEQVIKKMKLLDKSIKILKTNRGGKITYHGPGQLICYFVIDLKKEKKILENLYLLLKKQLLKHLNIIKLKHFQIKKILEFGIMIIKN